VPVQEAARRWVTDALALARPADGGRLVVVDYAATTAELAARPPATWLRTYRAHERGGPPLHEPGRQDITADVCLDQLPAPTSTTTQAQWLRAHGIDALVAEGRRVWEEQAHVGDLPAVRMRSRITEAEALLDPGGLGGFTVAIWSR
jgi:SAM-dependent MidA family methyltransferase